MIKHDYTYLQIYFFTKQIVNFNNTKLHCQIVMRKWNISDKIPTYNIRKTL